MRESSDCLRIIFVCIDGYIQAGDAPGIRA
jgi:hypothetical protein